jgi:lipopolysaccharide heptosyltransferase II
MQEPQKILVINLMHIGDLLLVTPVLRALRTRYSQAHIALLADKKLEDLVRLNQNIDELITIDKKGYHNTFIHYLQFIGEIRRQRFDLVINLHANERASFIAALSGGKKIVGYSTLGPGIFFSQVIPNRKAIKHQVHAHFDVLREALGMTRFDDRGIEMWVEQAAFDRADTVWGKAYPAEQGPVVGLNIGASWPTKRWCKDYFAQLADELLTKGYGVAYFGGPMDVELVEETIALMKQRQHPRLQTFTGTMTLMELAALLKKCAVFVTNDSGPMHVAVAMNVPVVSMFGPSPVPGFYPYNDRSVVIKTSYTCHPCGKHQCPTQHECMKEIDVATVLKYTLEQLEQPRKYIPGNYRLPGWENE